MVKTSTSRNIRVGVIVIIGIVCLIGALYLIGDKQHLFGSTVIIKTRFSNVNGLTVGNNVRYGGIDVGTVSAIRIVNDSLVQVEMRLESDILKYIRTNAVATIATDGLMGNKLININSTQGSAPNIVNGGSINSIEPLDTEAIMRTLSETNTEVLLIAQSLKNITSKIEEENMIWNLLRDSVISINIRNTMKNLDQTSVDLNTITRSFKRMTHDIESGEGLMGSLIYDTVFMKKLDLTMTNVEQASDSLNKLTHDISRITEHVRSGQGAAGTILMDKDFEQDLTKTLENVKNASEALEENMEALRHNFLFKRYFKTKEKKEKKP